MLRHKFPTEDLDPGTRFVQLVQDRSFPHLISRVSRRQFSHSLTVSLSALMYQLSTLSLSTFACCVVRGDPRIAPSLRFTLTPHKRFIAPLTRTLCPCSDPNAML